MGSEISEGVERRPDAGSALAAFRRAVLGDGNLAAQLGKFEDPRSFVECAVRLAKAEGLVLSADEIEAELRPDPLGIGRFMAAPGTLDRWPPLEWAPARSVPTGGAPCFDWIYFGRKALTEPFYEDAVRRLWPRPLNLLMRGRMSLEALVAGAGADEAVPIHGFIFHMSRCGSTLLAQMLTRAPENIVLSEPEPLDAVIRWTGADVPPPLRVAAVQAIVKALGRDRSGQGRRLFVKLDAWHTLALPLLREAFPGVPWLFLYRDPVEVMASQMRMPGLHAVPGIPGHDVLGIEGGDSMSREDYCALALARICGAVLDHWPLGGGLLLNYSELSGALPTRVAEHFGLRPTAAEAAAMASTAALHPKTGEPFSPDQSSKRAEASAAVLEAVEPHLRAVFERLETLRTAAL